MKNRVLIVLLLTNQLIAQLPPPGGYRPNPDLDKFAGTWVWTSGNDTLTVVLQTQKILMDIPGYSYYDDDLIGWHRYVKNGIVVQEDLKNVGTQWAVANYRSASSLFGNTQTADHLFFSIFKDYSDNAEAQLEFELLPGCGTEASWTLGYLTEYYGVRPQITLPTNLILTKQ